MSQTNEVDDAIVIERRLDAPIEEVWRMWTDATDFRRWYGPAGATVPMADFDVRVGGRRTICMEVATPDGPMRMWFHGEHRTVDAPTTLVYTEQMTDEHGTPTAGSPHTEVRVLLAVDDAGTRLLLTHVGLPADSPGATGWNMALDELTTLLTT